PADEKCEAFVPDFTSGIAASDDRTPPICLSMDQSPAAGTLVGVGSHAVTLTVADLAGNKTTCTTTFTVGAASAPSIVSCPPAASATAGANCQAAIPDLTGGVSATDNCTPAGSLVVTQSPAAGTLVGVGPHTVTLAVTDLAGNKTICTTTFTV